MPYSRTNKIHHHRSQHHHNRREDSVVVRSTILVLVGGADVDWNVHPETTKRVGDGSVPRTRTSHHQGPENAWIGTETRSRAKWEHEQEEKNEENAS